MKSSFIKDWTLFPLFLYGDEPGTDGLWYYEIVISSALYIFKHIVQILEK